MLRKYRLKIKYNLKKVKSKRLEGCNQMIKMSISKTPTGTFRGSVPLLC